MTQPCRLAEIYAWENSISNSIQISWPFLGTNTSPPPYPGAWQCSLNTWQGLGLCHWFFKLHQKNWKHCQSSPLQNFQLGIFCDKELVLSEERAQTAMPGAKAHWGCDNSSATECTKTVHVWLESKPVPSLSWQLTFVSFCKTLTDLNTVWAFAPSPSVGLSISWSETQIGFRVN